MARKRLLFDWSILDRYTLANQLWELHPRIVSQDLTVKQLHTILSTYIKSIVPLGVKKIRNEKISSGIVYIGGTYFSDLDKRRQKCIILELVYKNNQDTYCLDSRSFWRFCQCFADTVLHEIIHMRQFRRRKFKFLPEYESNAEKTEQRQEQTYLGCSDEIDAYGFNIACELYEKFKGNQKKIIKYLDENQKNKRRKLNSWRMYLKAFDYNHDHAIIRRLKKKVVRYLPYAELGKPYRNKDWINW